MGATPVASITSSRSWAWGSSRLAIAVLSHVGGRLCLRCLWAGWSRKRDRREHQAVTCQPPAREARQLAAVEQRSADKQTSVEGAAGRVEDDGCVFEAQPAPGQRKPSLVYGLLGAEQQSIPVNHLQVAPELTQPGQLLRPRDLRQYPVWERRVHLGVDAHRRDLGR